MRKPNLNFLNHRINLRIKAFGYTFFALFSRTQTVEGLTSKMKNGKHIPLWDIDGEFTTPKDALTTLKIIQKKYGLSNIYIVSDKEGSYRAWCYSQISWTTYIRILADSLSIIDYNFFLYTIRRGKATLRTSNKNDRPKQKIIAVLESYFAPIPIHMEQVIYDTGFEKCGLLINVPDLRRGINHV